MLAGIIIYSYERTLSWLWPFYVGFFPDGWMEGGTEEDSIVRSGRLGLGLLLKPSSYFNF